MEYVPKSARIQTAIAQLQEDILNNRLQVTTKAPTPLYPDGYQVLKRNRTQIGVIGFSIASEQLGRTDSFGG
jgi:hypothetical protein